MRLPKFVLVLLLVGLLISLSGEAVGNEKGAVGFNVGGVCITGDTPDHYGYGYSLTPYFHYPLWKVSNLQLGLGLTGGYASVSREVSYNAGIVSLKAYPILSYSIWKGLSLCVYPFEAGLHRWSSERGTTKLEGWAYGFASAAGITVPLKGPWGLSITGKAVNFTTDKLDTRVGGEGKDGSLQIMLGFNYSLGYTKMATKQDLARLENARKAAEFAEMKLKEKEAEKTKLEAQLSAQQSKLRKLEARRDAVKANAEKK